MVFFLLSSSIISASECLSLFRNIVEGGSKSKTNYQLNYDKTIKRLKSFKEKYRNQLTLKTAYEYDGEEIYRIDMPARGGNPIGRIILSSGVHGNESVTTAALVDIIEEIVHDSNFRNLYDFVIYPNMNAGGLKNNSRYLNNGADFNRTFKVGKEEKLTKLFKESLKGERFDLALDLHEAYQKPGFFIIKAQEDDSNYIKTVLSEINSQHLFQSPDGLYPYNVPMVKNPNKTSYILESLGVTTSLNKGTVKAFYRDVLGAKNSYTVESPGQIELGLRLEIYKRLIMSFLRNF